MFPKIIRYEEKSSRDLMTTSQPVIQASKRPKNSYYENIGGPR